MTQRPSSLSVATSAVAEREADLSTLTESGVIPALTDSGIFHCHGPHGVEREVQQRLQAHPGLKFSRLHVHQCQDGICLEGFLESNANEVDLCDVVRGIQGVTTVINRVVLAHPTTAPQSMSSVPQKG